MNFNKFQKISKIKINKFLRISKNFKKFLQKFLRISIVFLLISIWIFPGFPVIWQNPRIPPKVKEAKALDVSPGDGLVIYGVSANTTPQWRTYNGSTNSFGAQTGTVAGATGLNFVIKTSPKKQEAIAGYTDSSGVLRILCYDGTTWSNEWSVTVGGTGSTKRFDIAYETNSGDVLVAYGNNGATIGFRTKPGNTGCGSANWSAASTFTPLRTTGTINWIRLEADPRSTSNVIFIAWEDSTGSLSARSWDGTTWNNNEPSAAFSTNIENTGTAGDSLSFDIAFESQTGNLIIVWSPNNTGANTCTAGTNCIMYSRYTTSWSANTAIPTVADPATNVDLCSNPNTNEIVMAAIDNNSADLSLAYWSGSAWTGSANVDITAQAPAAGTKLVACGWLIAGSTTRSVVVYNDAGATNIGWVIGSGGTFTIQNDFTPTPAFGNPQKWYDIQTDPFNKDRLIFTVSDVNNDLFAKRLVMTSAPAFTWTNADSGAALQANLPQATAQPFSFAYWNFIPSPTFNQSAYRFFQNLDSTSVGNPLALQDTAATLTSSGQAFRLRMLIHIGVNQLNQSAQSFKLQFAQRGTDNSCDTSFTGETYQDVTTSTVIAFNDNPTPTDGSALTATSSDPTHGADTVVNQTYDESNPFTNSIAAIPSGQDGKWDFSLKDNGATANTAYCFRIVKADGTLLDTYSVIPQITTASAGATVSCSVSTTTVSLGTWSGGDTSIKAASTTLTISCSNTTNGCSAYVKDQGDGSQPGLYKSTSPTYLIISTTTTLTAGTEGYGLQAATTTAGTGGTLSLNSVYNKSGNDVGGLSLTNVLLASSTVDLSGREIVNTFKASIKFLTPSGNYSDTVTFSCVAN